MVMVTDRFDVRGVVFSYDRWLILRALFFLFFHKEASHVCSSTGYCCRRFLHPSAAFKVCCYICACIDSFVRFLIGRLITGSAIALSILWDRKMATDHVGYVIDFFNVLLYGSPLRLAWKVSKSPQ